MRVVLVAGLLLLVGPGAGATSHPPERLVFASDRTGTFQLYAVSPSGDALAQLSFGDLDSCNPTPAPSGRWLAFTRSSVQVPAGVQRLGCRQHRSQIWIARGDGSRARQLSIGFDPAWRPDATRLVFVDGTGIVSVRPDGTGRRRITAQSSDRAPRWAPNGRALLVRRREQLVVIGSGTSRVVAPQAFAGAWSPDARWIAYTTRTGLSLVRPDGRARRALVTGATFPPGDAPNDGQTPAWSPDGRSIAYVDTNGTAVVDVRTRTVRRIGHGFHFDRPVWSRDGRRLALIEPQGGVSWAFVRNPELRTSVYEADSDDQLTVDLGSGFLAVPGSSPGVEPIPRLVTVSDRDLRVRHPVAELTAVDGRLLYSLCDGVLGVWRPGSTGIVPIFRGGVNACTYRHFDSRWVRPALGTDAVAWLETDAGTSITVTLMLGQPGSGAWAEVRSARGVQGPPYAPALGYVLGDGRDLVFSTWQICTSCPGADETDELIVAQKLFRLEGMSEREIASAQGPLEPLDFDDGRLVLRRPSALELRNRDGTLLRAIPVERVLAAELAGDDLAVLRAGELRHYSASTGVLAHAWPLPNIPSAGRCRLRSCPPTRLRLVSVARGLALYTIDTSVYLLRLGDGASMPVGQADVVDLDPTGLYTATRNEPAKPASSIHFTPYADLPLRVVP